MNLNKQVVLIAGVVWLAGVQTSVAQVQAGKLSMDLNGLLSAGYTGDYGNLTPSDHGITLGGSGTLSGYYYDPNFLSFTVDPFYNQSRANSGYSSLTDSSGVIASTSIFAGSNYPGTVSYSQTFNGTGNFGIPGVANYTSHGDASVFNVGWSEHLPNLPTLSLDYQQGGNQYSLYGTSSDINSSFRGFSANAGYVIGGFSLSGGYRYQYNQLDVPADFADQGAEKSDSAGNSFSVGLGHSLPFHGSFSAGATRSDITANSLDGNYSATLDTATAGASFNPIERLNFGVNAQYNDNLEGTINQAILSAGGLAPQSPPDQASHVMDVTGYANYTLPAEHVTLNGYTDHRDGRIMGASYASDADTGTATYGNVLLGGFLDATLGATRTDVSPGDHVALGLISLVNYSRKINRWTLTGLFNYTQNQEAYLFSYTTSSLGYSAGVARKIGRRSSWSAGAGGSRSVLTGQPGSATSGQSYSTAYSGGWISASAGYSKASGNAIVTGTGLVPTPVPLPLLPASSVVLYGGHAYSASVGSSPIRGLTLSAGYSKAISDTQNGAASSNNKMDALNTFVQYQVRKIYFRGGYSRLVQGFSQSGGPPAMLGSFYLGLTRWFNFF